MSDIVISVEKLSKQYVIGGARDPRDALRHRIEDWVRSPWKVFQKSAKRASSRKEFWALKDVTFDVRQGDVVGFIGRNGAGKSTLLKILSRITDPTTGRVSMTGRVASLLEVGTGFHQELTGRENIFMNGAILGMSREEIRKKFDEIVAFSEVEAFLDTPVKRYSSGMYVRLAFAVAAHLEPEILIVDEVLAVGDDQFQKKCLGKMQDVSRGGRTVLFVSHNIAAVRALCNRGILLRSGNLIASGSINEVTAAYMDSAPDQIHEPTLKCPAAPKDCEAWMESITLLCDGQPGSAFETGDTLGFDIKFRTRDAIQKPILGFLIRSSRGENVLCANNRFLPAAGSPVPVKEGVLNCDLGVVPLMAGSYSISFWLCRENGEQHHLEDFMHFTVEAKDIWGTGKLPPRAMSCMWWPTQFRNEPVGEALLEKIP